MKIKDFDFRLVLTPAQLADLQCDNKGCPCQSPLAYGNEAKCMLSECIDTEAEVELWSGLYDKNNIKIYENDIVKYGKDDGVLVVVFSNIGTGQWFLSGYRRKVYLRNDYKGVEYVKGFSKRLEVIGNIHETPELLKLEKSQKGDVK